MADIYGSHFEYAGISSRRYGLIFVNVDTTRFTQMSGSLEGVTVFHRGTKRRYLIDDDYSDFPLSYELDIITDNERGIELNERREIEKWLFNKHEYRKLYLDMADDCMGETCEIINGEQKRIYLNCRFLNPERLEYNGGIIGYRVTLEADSGMWWQDAVTQEFTIDNSSNEEEVEENNEEETETPPTSVITVGVDTDIDDYTYPKVIITMGESGGDVIITNNTDDSTRLTKFTEVPASASITINGGLNYISGQYYAKFAIKNFPRLLDGDNSFTIIGDVASISFEFQNRRML